MYLLIQEMRAYLQWYKKNGAEPFFHRKSGRVVLSLLHVEHKGKAEFVRGINSEVSLPTGSICAERAAISNARTAFPSMIRKQMKGVAVLEVPLLNLGTNILNHFFYLKNKGSLEFSTHDFVFKHYFVATQVPFVCKEQF